MVVVLLSFTGHIGYVTDLKLVQKSKVRRFFVDKGDKREARSKRAGRTGEGILFSFLGFGLPFPFVCRGAEAIASVEYAVIAVL